MHHTNFLRKLNHTKVSAKTESYNFFAKTESYKFSAKNATYTFSAKKSSRRLDVTQFHARLDFPWLLVVFQLDNSTALRAEFRQNLRLHLIDSEGDQRKIQVKMWPNTCCIACNKWLVICQGFNTGSVPGNVFVSYFNFGSLYPLFCDLPDRLVHPGFQ